jgi:hypothetical protein
MKHAIDLDGRIPGTYWHAAAILKLELNSVVRTPLEELRFEIGGGAITRRVDAEVGPMETGPASLRVPLHWKASDHPKLFPVMDADLHISDVNGNHVVLRVDGVYHAPLALSGPWLTRWEDDASPGGPSAASSTRCRGGSARSSSSMRGDAHSFGGAPS